MGHCKPTILLLAFLIFTVLSAAGQDEYKYIVFFGDKEGSPYTLEEAEEFMSPKALARRYKYNIDLTATDLPLSTDYISALEEEGYATLGQSNWLNALLISSPEEVSEDILLSKPYVKHVIWAALEIPGGRSEPMGWSTLAPAFNNSRFWQTATATDHGSASGQIRMLNGQFLHDNGWMGQGMTLAVLDAGFIKVDELLAFSEMIDEERVTATYDFVDYDHDVFESSGHGTNVLSTMAGELDQSYMGTAPEANYQLLKTEDINSEQIVEEFNYVLGLEYADQMGADIINTSLGYTRYNHVAMDHAQSDLDGDHLVASVGADLAASKGLIVINSAGNEGNNSWRYTSIPADGDSVLAVGSVSIEGVRSTFSGEGWPESENIKPNVMALGEAVAIINTAGEIVNSNGTSFSAPIVAGLTACLWQAFPERNNMEIIRAIEQSSSQYLNPDKLSGYGIPDFQAAYALLYQERNELDIFGGVNIFPNPFTNNITLTLSEAPDQDMTIDLINDIGQVIFEEMLQSGSRKTVNLRFNGIMGLNMGMYFLRIRTADKVFMFKMIKV